MITVKEMILQLLELPMNGKLNIRVEKPGMGAHYELESELKRLTEGVIFDRESGEYYLE